MSRFNGRHQKGFCALASLRLNPVDGIEPECSLFYCFNRLTGGPIRRGGNTKLPARSSSLCANRKTSELNRSDLIVDVMECHI